MAAHLPAITVQNPTHRDLESNHDTISRLPNAPLGITWYLSVFGHGAENARLNPSMILFSGFVTPGERPKSGTPRDRPHAKRLTKCRARETSKGMRKCEVVDSSGWRRTDRSVGRRRRTSRRPAARPAAACRRRRAAARRTPAPARRPQRSLSPDAAPCLSEKQRYGVPRMGPPGPAGGASPRRAASPRGVRRRVRGRHEVGGERRESQSTGTRRRRGILVRSMQKTL